MVAGAYSRAPSPHIMSEQGKKGQGVGLGYQTQRPSSSETPLPEVFTDFQNGATS